MKTWEDFEFSSPLPPREVLKRLGRHPGNPGNGLFYGYIQGNNFNLRQDYGIPQDDSDDPLITGYVQREGEGSRIFARLHIPEMIAFKAQFGTVMLLGAMVMMWVLMPPFRGKIHFDGDFFSFIWQNIPFFFHVVTLLLAPVIGWRYMRKFNREGKNVLISKFVEYLEAGFPPEPSLSEQAQQLKNEWLREKELQHRG